MPVDPRALVLLGLGVRDHMGMGQNSAIVLVSIYQGKPFWIPTFDPHPHEEGTFHVELSVWAVLIVCCWTGRRRGEPQPPQLGRPNP